MRAFRQTSHAPIAPNDSRPTVQSGNYLVTPAPVNMLALGSPEARDDVVEGVRDPTTSDLEVVWERQRAVLEPPETGSGANS
jgi:hypothetical protein